MRLSASALPRASIRAAISAFVAFAAVSSVTLAEIDRVDETWQRFDTKTAAKGDILSGLRGALGYGGVIHQFKNFVLRKDRSRIIEVDKKLSEVSDALTAYSALAVGDREKVALSDIQATPKGTRVVREIAVHVVGQERPALLYAMIVLYQPKRG